MDGHISRFIRRLLRRHAQLEESRLVDRRFVCRIFQIQTFVGQVPQVLILGVVGFLIDLQRDIVLFCILNFLFTGIKFPEPPRSNDIHLRSKRMDGKLKTHLIVALAGAQP